MTTRPNPIDLCNDAVTDARARLNRARTHHLRSSTTRIGCIVTKSASLARHRSTRHDAAFATRLTNEMPVSHSSMLDILSFGSVVLKTAYNDDLIKRLPSMPRMGQQPSPRSALTFRLLNAKELDLVTLARAARTSVDMIDRYYASTLTAEMNRDKLHSFRRETRFLSEAKTSAKDSL